MNVLGIETATAVCAAALVREGNVVRESFLDAGRVHAEKLMDQIVAVLGPGGLESLGGIAVFGPLGFIVGPVIAALFVAVLDIYGMEFERQLKCSSEPPAPS